MCCTVLHRCVAYSTVYVPTVNLAEKHISFSFFDSTFESKRNFSSLSTSGNKGITLFGHTVKKMNIVMFSVLACIRGRGVIKNNIKKPF